MVKGEKSAVRASGAITIEWNDFGDEQESNFTWGLHYEPPLGHADHARVARLLREIAQREEAALEMWPTDDD